MRPRSAEILVYVDHSGHYVNGEWFESHRRAESRVADLSHILEGIGYNAQVTYKLVDASGVAVLACLECRKKHSDCR